MRAHRFRPSVELLGLRITPSDVTPICSASDSSALTKTDANPNPFDGMPILPGSQGTDLTGIEYVIDTDLTINVSNPSSLGITCIP